MPIAYEAGWCITGVKDGQVVAAHRLHTTFCAYDGVQFCRSCRKTCPVCELWVHVNQEEGSCVEE